MHYRHVRGNLLVVRGSLASFKIVITGLLHILPDDVANPVDRCKFSKDDTIGLPPQIPELCVHRLLGTQPIRNHNRNNGGNGGDDVSGRKVHDYALSLEIVCALTL